MLRLMTAAVILSLAMIYAPRNVDNLVLPKPKTNYCTRTFFYRGSKLYNELPINLGRPNT